MMRTNKMFLPGNFTNMKYLKQSKINYVLIRIG
jgi:hypothetical protein